MRNTIERPVVDLARRLWTAKEFERAGDMGLFGPEERLELGAGEILVKRSPQGSRHAAVIDLVAKALHGTFAAGHVVRVQTPLALGPSHRPEPDLAVVIGNAWQYLAAHPTTAVLVVEVSDTTLTLDRTLKAEVYAAPSIPDYWIINVVDNVLEVRRNPVPAGPQSSAHYESVAHFLAGQTIAPLSAP